MDINISVIAQLLLKTFTLIGLAVYAIFGIIIVRQEHLMANVLEEATEPVLRILVYIHLAASIGLFFLALVIL